MLVGVVTTPPIPPVGVTDHDISHVGNKEQVVCNATDQSNWYAMHWSIQITSSNTLLSLAFAQVEYFLVSPCTAS